MGEKYFIWVIKRLFHREYQPRKNKQFVGSFHNLKYRKIILRNSFADTYRSNSTNVFAENFNNGIELNQQSSTLHSNNDNGNGSNMKNSNNLNENE